MTKISKDPIRIFTSLLVFIGNSTYTSEGKNISSLKSKIVISSIIVELCCGILCTYLYWGDGHIRFLFIEDIISTMLVMIVTKGLIYSPNNCKKLMDVLEYSTIRDDKYSDKNVVDHVLNKADTFLWNLMRLMLFGLFIYWLFVGVVPLLKFILYIFNNNKTDINKIATPIPSITQMINSNNLIISTLNFIIQMAISFIQAYITGTYLLLETCSLVYISFELEILIGTIKNMNKMVEKPNLLDEYQTDVLSTHTVLYDIKLKQLLKYIHQHHLRIIQKVKGVNESLKISLLLYNQVICFHCSIVLYCMFQNNELSGKGRYVIAYLTTINCYGLTCVMGQHLMNKSEDLWTAVALCSWEDKPLWFKHSIKMLLIGTCKKLQLEPGGLYALNLEFLLKVLQVSYSYCNLMLQFNKAKVVT